MATYKEIVGQKITNVTSDPSDPKTGQMWYNSTTGTLRGLGITEAFSSSSPLVYTNFSGGTFGTQTAAVIGGGYSPTTNPPGAGTAKQQTQEYNGSAWSLGGNLNTGRGHLFGFGVETAGVVSGGYTTTNLANTEEYNGSSWTAGNSMGTARRGMEGAGVETAGLVFGGYVGPAGSTATEEYDGTNWTSGGALTTSNPINYYNAGTGTQTAGLRMGGQGTNVSEEYDGSSWTSGNNMNSPRAYGGSFGAQTSALIGGGSNPPTTYLTAAEKYDGTSFSVSPATLSSPRAITGQAAGGTSGNTAGIFGGGYSPTDSPAGDTGNTIAEEYNVSTNIITPAAWASSNNLNTGRNAGAGFGIQTAAVMTGGNAPPESNATEEYDGSSWTSVTNYPASKRFIVGTGTLTAGLVAGGSPDVATVNKYDGTNWTAANSIPTATNGGTMFGTQTASVFSVGRNPSVTTNTYEFDGTNWTAGGAAGTGRYFLDSSGTLTAGLMFGGQTSGPTARNETEEYNGTAWSEQNNLGTARYGLGSSGAGTQTDTIAFAGNNPAVVLTEGYDGTSWSTRPNMATARRFISGAGTATAGLAFGGNPPNNSTEEFTGETTAGNVTNFSTS